MAKKKVKLNGREVQFVLGQKGGGMFAMLLNPGHSFPVVEQALTPKEALAWAQFLLGYADRELNRPRRRKEAA